MAKRTALVLSSLLAGTVITAAAAPASAQTFLDYAIDAALGISPENNNWASPCAINWDTAPITATTNGVCFFTLSLKKADPTITNPILTQWWGSTNPPSPSLHTLILENDPAVKHFEHISDFTMALAADLLVTSYQQSSGSYTGYTMMLAEDPQWWETTMEGYDRYLCTILDSTRTPHGKTDFRWMADGGAHDWGIGFGEMFVDVDPASGEIVRHTWSKDPKGTSYTQAVRNMVVGRFIR